MSELDVIQGFFAKEQKEKIDKYRILNETVIKGQILFTGSSLMEQFPINELLMTEKMDCIISIFKHRSAPFPLWQRSILFNRIICHHIHLCFWQFFFNLHQDLLIICYGMCKRFLKRNRRITNIICSNINKNLRRFCIKHLNIHVF